MDFRKIIGFGNGGYVVSLPRNWIRDNKLKKGDILNFDERKEELVFSITSRSHKKEEKSVTIEVGDKDPERVKAEIVSAYLRNFDTIKIISKKKFKDAVEVKNILRDLAGIEILEQTSTKIVAKDLLNIREISVQNIIRRMDNITRGMIDDCRKSMLGNDHSSDIMQRDFDVNRLYYLATRVIKGALEDPSMARALKDESPKLALDWLVILRLEKIADRQKRISRYINSVTLNEDTLKGLIKLFDEIKESYYDVMKAYYTDDTSLAFDVEFSNKERIRKNTLFLDENSGCSIGGCSISEAVQKDIKKDEIIIDRGMMKKARKEMKKRSEGVNTCVQIAKIIENFNAMASSVKFIARRVMDSG